MKRQHIPSLANSSGKPKLKGSKATTCDYRKEFVKDWIARLPEPCDLLNEHMKTAEMNDKNKIHTKSHLKKNNNNNNNRNNNNKNDENNNDNKTNKNHNPIESILKSLNDFDDNLIDVTGVTCNNAKAAHPPEAKEITKEKSKNKLKEVKISEQDKNFWVQVDYWKDLRLLTLIDYPKDAVTYGDRYTEFPVESVFKKLHSLQITIGEVLKPYKFWFFCSQMRSTTNLSEKMSKVYGALKASELAMSHCHIFPGQTCAVPIDEKWLRGIISAYLLGSTIKVFLVDLGVDIKIPPASLKYLKTEFLDLPKQAMRGTLVACNEHADDGLKEVLNKHVYGKIFSASIVQILHCQEKRVVEMEIPEIFELLIRKGFANYLSKGSTKKVKRQILKSPEK